MYQDHQGLPRRFYKEQCKEGDQRRGRQKKRWENNVGEWIGLKFCHAIREAEDKIKWRERVANVCGAPTVIDYGIGAGAWVLNASYMFQPLMSFCIHTQKRKQLPSIHWKTSISHPHKEGQAVDMHIQRKKQLTWCTKDQAVTMQTVNNQLPSSHREKSSCYTHTHAQAFTNTPWKKNKQRRTSK